MLKRSFGVLAIAAVLVACSSAGASPAPSESSVSEHDRYPPSAGARPAPSESTVSEHDRYRDSLLSPTFDVLAQLPGFQAGGLEPDVDEMVVYWKGELGPEAQAAVEESNRRGVVANVIPVPYSYDELRRIAGPLIEALVAKGIETAGYTIGDPFDEIAMWGHALDKSPELRRLAEDTAADVLPPDLKLVIVPSPGELIPADWRNADGGNSTVSAWPAR